MCYTKITRKANNKTDTLKVITQGSMNQTSTKYQAETFSAFDYITIEFYHMMFNCYTFNYKPKYRVTRIPNHTSFLRYGSLQLVIMYATTYDNLRNYIKELNQKEVRCVVRTCEQTYSEEPL
eukprot:104309_1